MVRHFFFVALFFSAIAGLGAAECGPIPLEDVYYIVLKETIFLLFYNIFFIRSFSKVLLTPQNSGSPVITDFSFYVHTHLPFFLKKKKKKKFFPFLIFILLKENSIFRA